MKFGPKQYKASCKKDALFLKGNQYFKKSYQHYLLCLSNFTCFCIGHTWICAHTSKRSLKYRTTGGCCYLLRRQRGHWKTHRFSKRGDLREIKSINPTFITLPRGGQFITPNIFLPLLLRQWPLQ